MNAGRLRGPSIADATRAYIDEHPSIREALRDDLVNFALLARKIQAETQLPNEEAITIACRRYQKNLAAAGPSLAAVRALLARSRLEVHARVGLIRFEDDWEVLDHLLAAGRRLVAEHGNRALFEIFEGTRAVTIVCEEPLVAPVLAALSPRVVIGVERGLASLAFRSQPEVSETSGVLSYMAEALYRAGVNILETVSVHSDSIFVFREKEMIRAYQVLSELLASAPGPAPPRNDHR